VRKEGLVHSGGLNSPWRLNSLDNGLNSLGLGLNGLNGLNSLGHGPNSLVSLEWPK